MAVFQVKQIKAQAMNIDKVRQELLNELRRQGKIVEKEYLKTTRTWNGEKPKFESLVGLERGDGSGSVLTGPTGSTKAVSKYNWLDYGTRPHTITAKRARLLRFKVGGFKAKTKPGVIGSTGGRAASGATIYKRSVHHPGTKARKFTETIQVRRKQPFINAMIKAKNKGLKDLYS